MPPPHARAAAAARHAARVAARPLHPFHAAPPARRRAGVLVRSALDDRALASEAARVAEPAEPRMDASGALSTLAARVAALPGKKAAKALRKAEKALMKALEAESSESSASSDGERVQLPSVATTTGRCVAAPSLGAAGAKALAFSLAGAARRAAAVESVAVVPDAPAIDQGAGADVSATTPPPPRVSVCTGPACTRLGADRIILALEADYPGGVRKCGCLGECDAGRAAASRATAWFAQEDGVALPLALAADALAEGDVSDESALAW